MCSIYVPSQGHTCPLIDIVNRAQGMEPKSSPQHSEGRLMSGREGCSRCSAHRTYVRTPLLAASYAWFSGHTSTTPCATAQGLRDTLSMASANEAASTMAKPAKGKADVMNGPLAVST